MQLKARYPVLPHTRHRAYIENEIENALDFHTFLSQSRWTSEVLESKIRVGGAFGNMKMPEYIRWPTKPVLCNKSMCHCNFDIMSKKLLPRNRYVVEEE